jgi:3-hydroxyacyl-[acyl-carrier-protein] dehydratase
MANPTPVNRSPAAGSDVLSRVKSVMRRDLKLGPDFPIPDDMAFFGGDADIDSLDVLLLLGSVEKEFGIKIPNEAVGRQVFQSVQTLVGYVQEQLAREGGESAPAVVVAGAGDDLLARLPHGPEFRFVTRVLAVRPGESAEAVWAPTGAEPFFAGHFPGRPIVPGVLLAESMAQVSGLAAQTGNQPMDGKLVQVDVRFEQPVVPPAEILIRSQLVRSVGGLTQFSVTASVGSIVVSRGTVTLNLSPIESAPVGGPR